MVLIGQDLVFPNPDLANEEGLLAIGGDLSSERLLLAYRNGIFPWFNEDEPILWWSPDPRCVMFPDKLKVSHSMKQLMRKATFRFEFNTHFKEVITACQQIRRKEGYGTWITNEMLEAYLALHRLGFAVSGECYHGDRLVGGLYGVLIDDCFFGESMFSLESNASKFAFIQMLSHLQETRNLTLVDCQQATSHLMSLGAELIPRKDFLRQISHLH